MRLVQHHLVLGTVMLSLVSLMPGCAPLKQYRTDYRPHPGSRTETNAIEETETNLLGFVEFDDHGWLWDANQMHAVVNRIAEEDKKQGLIILVLAHGWKHNASYQDANVASFRAVLADLQDVENKSSAQLPRPPRKVVGLYVGWRGLSQTLPVLKEVTFWERKRTAHAVGQGAVCELMAGPGKAPQTKPHPAKRTRAAAHESGGPPPTDVAHPRRPQLRGRGHLFRSRPISSRAPC